MVDKHASKKSAGSIKEKRAAKKAAAATTSGMAQLTHPTKPAHPTKH